MARSASAARQPAPVPVEVAFGGAVRLERCARSAASRCCARAFVTDEGNGVLDCGFGPLDDPGRLAEAIRSIPGVVEHGLFLGMAEMAYVGGPDGVEVLRT